uniref:Uncharacterized protein n=1 Tax=Mycena chlorophos TaxID=658473 RepID=A0ABQ0LC48_MYCCL|nr:predicted protein [Mycena chlorophos]
MHNAGNCDFTSAPDPLQYKFCSGCKSSSLPTSWDFFGNTTTSSRKKSHACARSLCLCSLSLFSRANALLLPSHRADLLDPEPQHHNSPIQTLTLTVFSEFTSLASSSTRTETGSHGTAGDG